MSIDTLIEHVKFAQKNMVRVQRDYVQGMMIALGSLFDNTVAKKFFSETRKVMGGEADKKNQYKKDLDTLRQFCGAIGMGTQNRG